MLRINMVLCAVLLFAQYQWWFGHNGRNDYAKEQRQVSVYQQENNVLQERNRLIYDEIDDLASGVSGVEELARSVLGYVKPTETFFRIVPKEAHEQE